MLSVLEADPSQAGLAARLHHALDQLEADPRSADCRRRRYQNIDLWGIPVVDGNEEWLILWEPGDDDSVIVQAITPAP